MKFIFYLFPYLLVIAISCSESAFSQGCSDAGFCTMGAMKPAQPYKSRLQVRLRSVEFSHYTGLTRFDDVIQAYIADLNVGIGERMMVQVKLPYQKTYGVMADIGGISDISLSATYNVFYRENVQVNVTVGAKIPTHQGDFTTVKEGIELALPMYYQSSLGTYDVVAGASLSTRGWMFAIGYQQALNKNKSEFKWGPWFAVANQIGIDSADINKYPSSPDLYRGKDIMLRIEKNFRFSKFAISTGLLPIFRLNKDVRTNPLTGEPGQEVAESDGLALSYLIGGSYFFSPKVSLNIMNGFRITKREFNPDGLSREFVNTVGLMYRF